MKKTRDFEIDCIRTIGLLCIILAHIPRVPVFLMALRRFDVPLMVILSGYLFSRITLSNQNKNMNIGKYFYSRIKRLVYPTWIFLTIFFLLILIVEIVTKDNFISLSKIARSYLLIDGIGYVWIIRIYLIVGILGPILREKIKLNQMIYYYLGYEICLTFLSIMNFKNIIIETLVITPLPYILLFIYGVNYSSFEKIKKINQRNQILGIVLLLSGIVLYYFISENYYHSLYLKYPPRFFYIFYGIFIANILLYNREKIFLIKNKRLKKIISFIGESTLWIYLWHILVVYGILLIEKFIIIDWKLLFLITLIVSFSMVYIQNIIIYKLMLSFPKQKRIIEIILKG